MKTTVRDQDYGFRKLVSTRFDTKGRGVTVGIHDDAGETEGGIKIAEVAAIHEFGLAGTERSFLRAYVDEAESEINDLLRQAGNAVVKGMDPEQALEIAGAKIAAGVRGYIQDGKVTPPSSDETNAKKGSSTTLIDTGALVGSITHKVES